MGFRSRLFEIAREKGTFETARRDDQGALAFERAGAAERPGAARQGEGEEGAAFRARLERECAAHAGDEPARDGEPQARAAARAGRNRLALLKLLEDFRARRGSDPWARVLDDEAQRAVPGRRDAHADAALLREVHRVAGEIDQHLTQPRRVPDDALGRLGSDMARDLEPLALSARREKLDDALDERRHSEFLPPQFEPASLDLGKIQNIVDELRERPRAIADRIDIARLLGLEPRHRKELREAENAVERRADLVTDGREEARLGFIGGFGAIARRGRGAQPANLVEQRLQMAVGTGATRQHIERRAQPQRKGEESEAQEPQNLPIEVHLAFS